MFTETRISSSLSHRVVKSTLALLLGATIATFALAQDAKMSSDEKAVAETIKQRLQDLRGAKDVELTASKTINGLYEVVVGGESFVYTDKDVNFIMQGRLLDGKSLQDLTAVSEGKLEQVDVKKLPIKNAVKIGKGSRVIYTFEDPRCGFCKKLAKDLSEMNDLTIYTFVVSFLGPESTAQAKSIMCNKKPDEAWLNTMKNNAPPNVGDADRQCEKRLDDNNALARKLRVNGTPAILFADGSRFKGYVPKDGIEARLTEIAKK